VVNEYTNKQFTFMAGLSEAECAECAGESDGERCTEALRQRPAFLAALRPPRPRDDVVRAASSREVPDRHRRRVEHRGTAQRTGGLRGRVTQRKDGV